MFRASLLCAVPLTAMFIIHCGSATSGGTDGGGTSDASQVGVDASVTHDAGSADAGETIDAGESHDAGETIDAGETTDAGVVDGTVLTASLDGSQVVPSVNTPATGSATFVIDSSRKKLTYTLTHDVANATEVDIRIGVAGQNGLSAYSLTPVSDQMSGTITITSVHATQLEAGNWYVVVHSPMYPDGEIRGQIEKQ